jgi:hypothetical protein
VSRPVDTLPTVSAALARVLAGKRPAWVSLATWMALRSAVEDVADDARAATREFAERPAAAALGCGQGSLRRWREPGGWLSE